MVLMDSSISIPVSLVIRSLPINVEMLDLIRQKRLKEEPSQIESISPKPASYKASQFVNQTNYAAASNPFGPKNTFNRHTSEMVNAKHLSAMGQPDRSADPSKKSMLFPMSLDSNNKEKHAIV